MRESRSYGSVRGVAGDRYPYRDSYFLFAALRLARRVRPTVGRLRPFQQLLQATQPLSCRAPLSHKR